MQLQNEEVGPALAIFQTGEFYNLSVRAPLERFIGIRILVSRMGNVIRNGVYAGD